MEIIGLRKKGLNNYVSSCSLPAGRSLPAEALAQAGTGGKRVGHFTIFAPIASQ
jgi:hypothetical protein